jgi:hypothetical protein
MGLTVKAQLTGKTLRWVVCLVLRDARRALTVREIVAEVEQNYVIPGRSGKAVSDCLRWEVGRGRVIRFGRGLYGAGRVPRSTEYGLRKRVEGSEVSLVARSAADLDAGVDDAPPPNLFTADGAINLDAIDDGRGGDD